MYVYMYVHLHIYICIQTHMHTHAHNMNMFIFITHVYAHVILYYICFLYACLGTCIHIISRWNRNKSEALKGKSGRADTVCLFSVCECTHAHVGRQCSRHNGISHNVWGIVTRPVVMCTPALLYTVLHHLLCCIPSCITCSAVYRLASNTSTQISSSYMFLHVRSTYLCLFLLAWILSRTVRPSVPKSVAMLQLLQPHSHKLSIYTDMWKHGCIHSRVYTCMNMYIYIYIYTHTHYCCMQLFLCINNLTRHTPKKKNLSLC